MSISHTLGKPGPVSILAGIVATVLYYMAHHRDYDMQPDESDANATRILQSWRKAVKRTTIKPYLAVFCIITVIVYGAFMVSISCKTCQIVDPNIPIQTGGTAPF